MKTIVLGYDDTEPSMRALQRVIELAKALDTEVVAVSVARPLVPAGHGIGPIDPVGQHANDRILVGHPGDQLLVRHRAVFGIQLDGADRLELREDRRWKLAGDEDVRHTLRAGRAGGADAPAVLPLECVLGNAGVGHRVADDHHEDEQRGGLGIKCRHR